MPTRDEFGDGEMFGRAKYFAGVEPRDLEGERFSFGTGHHAEIMRAIWGSSWADTCKQEAEREPSKPALPKS